MEISDKHLFDFNIFSFVLVFIQSRFFSYTGWPQKVSHYHESSLNRIKTRHKG